MSQTYYTVGYQRKNIKVFIGILKDAGVNTLYDIRTYPQSRVVPYNSDNLMKALLAENIRYRWEPKLGGKHKFPDAVRAKHLPVPGDGNVAFMCFEENINECHRREIAALVEKIKKVKVIDLCVPQAVQESLL